MPTPDELLKMAFGVIAAAVMVAAIALFLSGAVIGVRILIQTVQGG